MFAFLYRMPIWIVFFALIVILLTYGYLFSRKSSKKQRDWLIILTFLFLGSVVFILEMTLLTRSEGSNGLYLAPFRFLELAKINPEIYRSIIMNIALFIPFGMFLSSLLSYKLKISTSIAITVFLGLIFSSSIEYAQFIFKCGETEFDDVIFNSIGTFVGSVVICHRQASEKITCSRFYDKRLIKFYAITFGFSWTLWSFVSYFTTHLSNRHAISTALYIAGCFAPLIGALIINTASAFNSPKKFKAKYLIHFTAIIASIIVLFITSSSAFVIKNATYYIEHFLTYILIFSIPQEIGWRKTAISILKEKLPIPLAYLFNGFMFSLWMIPSYYMIGSPLSKVPFLVFVFISVCFSCIFSSIYIKTHSLILNVLANCITIVLLNAFAIENNILFALALLMLSIISTIYTQKTERR